MGIFEKVHNDFKITVYLILIDDGSHKTLSSMSLLIDINNNFIMNHRLYIHFNLKNVQHFD